MTKAETLEVRIAALREALEIVRDLGGRELNGHHSEDRRDWVDTSNKIATRIRDRITSLTVEKRSLEVKHVASVT